MVLSDPVLQENVYSCIFIFSVRLLKSPIVNQWIECSLHSNNYIKSREVLYILIGRRRRHDAVPLFVLKLRVNVFMGQF